MILQFYTEAQNQVFPFIYFFPQIEHLAESLLSVNNTSVLIGHKYLHLVTLN